MQLSCTDNGDHLKLLFVFNMTNIINANCGCLTFGYSLLIRSFILLICAFSFIRMDVQKLWSPKICRRFYDSLCVCACVCARACVHMAREDGRPLPSKTKDNL